MKTNTPLGFGEQQDNKETQKEHNSGENEVLQVAEDGATETRAHRLNARRLLLDGVNVAVLKIGRPVQLAVALRNGVLDGLYTSAAGKATTPDFPNPAGSVDNLVQHIVLELLVTLFFQFAGGGRIGRGIESEERAHLVQRGTADGDIRLLLRFSPFPEIYRSVLLLLLWLLSSLHTLYGSRHLRVNHKTARLQPSVASPSPDK